MRTFANLLTTIVIASWVLAIAVLSLRNVTPVSLRFLTYQSIQLPFFLVLAFCAVLGMIFMALIQLLWGLGSSISSNSRSDDDLDDAFSFDDEDG
jgi:uncharacterized integral membrane protein